MLRIESKDMSEVSSAIRLRNLVQAQPEASDKKNRSFIGRGGQQLLIEALNGSSCRSKIPSSLVYS